MRKTGLLGSQLEQEKGALPLVFKQYAANGKAITALA